jgi:hypothetical protein
LWSIHKKIRLAALVDGQGFAALAERLAGLSRGFLKAYGLRQIILAVFKAFGFAAALGAGARKAAKEPQSCC